MSQLISVNCCFLNRYSFLTIFNKAVSAQGRLTSSCHASDRLCVRHLSGSGRGALAWAGCAARHGWLACSFCTRHPFLLSYQCVVSVPHRATDLRRCDARTAFQKSAFFGGNCRAPLQDFTSQFWSVSWYCRIRLALSIWHWDQLYSSARPAASRILVTLAAAPLTDSLTYHS